jgi:hypothetical protein
LNNSGLTTAAIVLLIAAAVATYLALTLAVDFVVGLYRKITSKKDGK